LVGVAVQDFEIIDHTADIGIVAHGESLREVFANAARAMFSLIADLDDVDESISCDVEVSGEDQEVLLVEWLNELIYLFDARNMVFRRFEILDIGRISLKARVYGEKLDLSRHRLKMVIKAATYHILKVERDDGFRAQVLFDV
jgi:SHS2 domain-containing protein